MEDLSMYGDSMREQLEGARTHIGETVFYNADECTIIDVTVKLGSVHLKIQSDEHNETFVVPFNMFGDK